MKHTATPWKISSHPGPEILIDRDVPFDFTKVLRDHVGSLKISKEDAEFIIQAVNAHDELVEACRAALRAMPDREIIYQLAKAIAKAE